MIIYQALTRKIVQIRKTIYNFIDGSTSKGRLYWLIIIIAVLLLKTLFLPIKLGDYNTYLGPWVEFIKNNGYFASLRYDFYNYSPSYIYILILIAKTGLNSLYMIKIISILFEFVLALYVGKILFLKTKIQMLYWLSAAILPLIPTVFLNGAYWGQCDSIYTTFVVVGIYYSLINKHFISVVLLAVAIAFKAQAVFILPYYFTLLLFGKTKWYYFLTIPIVYFISIMPAWLNGRYLTDLFSIYLNQSDYYQSLTMFMPNIYVWIQDADYSTFKLVGIITTTALTIFSSIYLKYKNFELNIDNLILLAFASVIFTPFILPGMHERYLYLGDVLAFIFLLWSKNNSRIPFAIWTVSFYAYISCSRLKEFLPLWPAFFVYLTAIILVLNQIKCRINQGKINYHPN